MASYEVECPKCNTPYVKEIEEDSDEYEMVCEDCGCVFAVFAEIIVDVVVTESEEQS
jgi:transcription initiation factor TFIIIB Brf1 subunit/transcription initiation factor TFIIB